MTTTAELVSKGVALLNEQMPDWRERVRVELLWMPSGTMCILGQLYGEFDIGAGALDIMCEEDRYGFCIPFKDADDDLYKFDYAELQAEWIRVLSDA
jgi:hypothetical protein